MKIRIDKTRLAFPALFEPRAFGDGDKPAYSAALLIPKDHPQVASINAAIATAAKEKWGAKADTQLQALRAADKTCLHNGDAKADYAGFADALFISARNAVRPTVVDTDRSPLTESDGKIYAGCYVNAVIEIWAQENSYGKRINATLMGVQFAGDGEAFVGGGAAKSDDFDDITAGTDAGDFM